MKNKNEKKEKNVRYTGLIGSISSKCSVCPRDLKNLAKTPPIGWNSYNAFGATVRESEAKENADFMAKNLLKLGWQYIVIDFCWFYPHHPKSNQDNPP